jgi:MFS family permease
MAAGNWYVYATTNSSGNFNKVWVAQGIGGSSSDAVAGPYASEAAAKGAANDLTAITGWRGTVATIGAGVGGAIGTALGGSIEGGALAGEQAANSVGNWEQEIANALAGLSKASTWIRVLKVVIGGVLFLLGVNKLTGTSGKLENIVSKVPIPA